VGFFKTSEQVYENKDLCVICSANIAVLEGSNVAGYLNLKHKKKSKNYNEKKIGSGFERKVLFTT
jgi:hypothetical protein